MAQLYKQKSNLCGVFHRTNGGGKLEKEERLKLVLPLGDFCGLGLRGTCYE